MHSLGFAGLLKDALISQNGARCAGWNLVGIRRGSSGLHSSAGKSLHPRPASPLLSLLGLLISSVWKEEGALPAWKCQ